MADRVRRISYDRLRELVSYDPETGIFTWLRNTRQTKAGTVAGRPRKDGIRIGLDGARYLAHVIAWFYMTGEWPEPEIDRLNGEFARAA